MASAGGASTAAVSSCFTRTDCPVRKQVGVLKARAVASAGGIPLVPVHHMEAHALVARLTGSSDDPWYAGAEPAVQPNVVLLQREDGLAHELTARHHPSQST